MLYDGALRFLEGGRQALLSGDLQKQNDQLQRSQKIVVELMSCLDLEHGGEIAKNLLALYTYVLNETVRANIEDDAEGIQRCIQILSDLRASWDSLEQGTRSRSELHAA